MNGTGSAATVASATPDPADGGRIEWHRHLPQRRKATAWAFLAGGMLLAVYFGILTATNSMEHALDELLRLWPWMLPLVLGFSFQVGLFAYARGATRGEGDVHSRGVAASGGASTLSMVACCAHHVTDVLPVVGLAGAATVLATYQGLFLLLGVLSNAIGLTYVLGMLRRHGLYPDRRSWLVWMLRWPFERMLIPVMGISVLVFVAALMGEVF